MMIMTTMTTERSHSKSAQPVKGGRLSSHHEACVESLYPPNGSNDRNEKKTFGQMYPKCPPCPWLRFCFLNAKTHGTCISLAWNLSATLYYLHYFHYKDRFIVQHYLFSFQHSAKQSGVKPRSSQNIGRGCFLLSLMEEERKKEKQKQRFYE